MLINGIPNSTINEPIVYDIPNKDGRHRWAERLDSYLSLKGRVAHLSFDDGLKKWVLTYQDTTPSLLITVLKVLTYCTIVAPLIARCTKHYLRNEIGVHDFDIITENSALLYLKALGLDRQEDYSNKLSISIDHLAKVGVSTAEDLKILKIDASDFFKMEQQVKTIKNQFIEYPHGLKKVEDKDKNPDLRHLNYEKINCLEESVEKAKEDLTPILVEKQTLMANLNIPNYTKEDYAVFVDSFEPFLIQLKTAKESPKSVKTFVQEKQVQFIESFTIHLTQIEKLLTQKKRLLEMLKTYALQHSILKAWEGIRKEYPNISLDLYHAMKTSEYEQKQQQLPVHSHYYQMGLYPV